MLFLYQMLGGVPLRAVAKGAETQTNGFVFVARPAGPIFKGELFSSSALDLWVRGGEVGVRQMASKLILARFDASHFTWARHVKAEPRGLQCMSGIS